MFDREKLGKLNIDYHKARDNKIEDWTQATNQIYLNMFQNLKIFIFFIMKNYKESGVPTEQHPTMDSSSASNDLETIRIAWEFIENKLPFTSTDVSKELVSRTRTRTRTSANPSAITKVLKKKLNMYYK